MSFVALAAEVHRDQTEVLEEATLMIMSTPFRRLFSPLL